MSSHRPCAACGAIHTPDTITPDTDFAELMAHAFHHVVSPLVRPDPSYEGPGNVFQITASFDDASSEMGGVFLDWIGDAALPEDLTEFADSTLGVGDYFAWAGKSLVTFNFDDIYWDSYGLDALRVLDRGYVFLLRASEVEGRLFSAWEPYDSEPAFAQAFIEGYVANAGQFEFCPPFKPASSGYDPPALTSAGVGDVLLAEAMRHAASRWREWATVLWEIQQAPPKVDVATIVAATGISAEDAEAALSITLSADRKEASATAEHTPEAIQKGLIHIYLRAIGRGVNGLQISD